MYVEETVIRRCISSQTASSLPKINTYAFAQIVPCMLNETVIRRCNFRDCAVCTTNVARNSNKKM